MNWQEVELKEVAEIVSGSTPSTTKIEYWENGDINWITPAEIINGNNWYYYETRKKITKKGLESASINLFPKGTVMLTSRAPIGKVAIAGKEMCSNQGFKNFICKKNELVPEYLYYWLRSKENYLNSIGRGATFKEISKSIVSKLKIPLPFKNEKPSIEEQERIVKILEKAEKLKEKSEKVEDLLDEYLKSVFNEMFFGKDKFEKVKLGEFATFQMGGTPPASEINSKGASIPWIKGSDLNKEYIKESENFITVSGMNNSRARYYEPGTILIGRTGQGKTRAKTAILMFKATTNETVIAIIPDFSKVFPEYLHFSLKSRYQELRDIGGDNQRGGITQNDLANLHTYLPPISLQKKFTEIVRYIEKIKDKISKTKFNSGDLFNSCIQKAFRGELK